MTRLRAFAVAFGCLLLSLAAVAFDAERRRANEDREARAEIAARVGFADLALSSSQRWIRHPSQVERGAPFADAPALLDVDPSGALIGPPYARGER